MRKQRVFFILFSALIIICTLLIKFRFRNNIVHNISPFTNKNVTIVIDPGHGGYDPGKVSSDNVYEKDINLSLSMHLKSLLEQLGYNIVMTRTSDIDLCSPKTTARKTDDLNNRIQIIENCSADYVISIHQNSFSDPSVHGAQIFYHSEGPAKELANMIQKKVNPERVAKSNTSYYMLRKTKCPAVIVECGFLSNPFETEQLKKDDYQKQIAQLIATGVDLYITSH